MKTAPENFNPLAAQQRLVARMVRTCLQRETFESLADLTAAVKTECATLKIHFTPDDLNGAYSLIASNARLVTVADFRPRLAAAGGTYPELTKAEAAAIVVELARRLGA